jgi:imidazolonepropionase-like amidohydrolase
MVAYAMSPVQALRATTITAAKVLGRSDDLGRIAEGYVADLAAIRGNPLQDPKVCGDVLVVLKEGHVVVDHRPRRER